MRNEILLVLRAACWTTKTLSDSCLKYTISQLQCPSIDLTLTYLGILFCVCAMARQDNVPRGILLFLVSARNEHPQ
ncbi:MAG: hypothetical protein LBE04_01215 [Prevotellaceae bacterium]|nr:hypothetical protein [Prevotellaceae bacterium]